MGILAMHIDDLAFCGNNFFQENVIAELKKIFVVGMQESGTFKFWRLGVRQAKNGITIDQNLYVLSITPIDIKKGRSLRKNDKLNQEEKTKLK